MYSRSMHRRPSSKPALTDESAFAQRPRRQALALGGQRAVHAEAAGEQHLILGILCWWLMWYSW